MNREVANLIAEEVSASIARIADIANGVLVPANDVRPNTQNLTPNTHVYSSPPSQTAIEFMINHALGMPGAQIEVTNTTESASRKLQSAKDRENGVVVKDHSILMLACEQQFKEFLPTAIDRLLELAAGVTVQYTHKDKTFTITHRPNARSIDYITSRTEGRFASVLSDLREKFENPELTYPYTSEDFDAMTQAERDALYECALRNAAKAPNTNTDPNCAADNIPSCSPPSPTCGRRVGDEGYNGGEGYKAEGAGSHAACNFSPFPARNERIREGGRGVRQECKAASESLLPAHITTANKRLADFLPKAVVMLKTLARGAQTVTATDTEENSVQHGPDLRANMYLVNRFLGVPPTLLTIENINPPMVAA